MQDANINNISSYFVLGFVYECPLSFLVHTGAGVTLLRGDVWEKAVPRGSACDYQGACQLVGVDGIPIKVHGAASVDVTVEGHTLSHQFIIADHITAEGILGMDFLEQNKCILDLCKGRLLMKDLGVVQLQPHSLKKPCSPARVNLATTLTIPAAAEVEVMGKIHTEDGNHTWMVENASTAPIIVARALVKPKNGLIPLHLTNTNLISVKVYQGSTVAQAEFLDESTINVVSENSTDQPSLHQPGSQGIPQEMIPEDITDQEKEKLLALLELHTDVIGGDNDLGCTKVLHHNIDNTGNASPIQRPVQRLSLPVKEEVKKLLEEMLQKDVVSPSTSPWASPVVLVRKKDGSTRFCIDYRKVNSLTRKDAYPIPKIDKTLDTLAGAKLFSTLDLRSGYWQVQVNPEHREKTAFCTSKGLFEFNVMPFGLCNAPATFQRLMDSVLAGLHWKTCLVYTDDIIVVGKSFDEHLCNLQAVLERLR